MNQPNLNLGDRVEVSFDPLSHGADMVYPTAELLVVAREEIGLDLGLDLDVRGKVLLEGLCPPNGNSTDVEVAVCRIESWIPMDADGNNVSVERSEASWGPSSNWVGKLEVLARASGRPWQHLNWFQNVDFFGPRPQ